MTILNTPISPLKNFYCDRLVWSGRDLRGNGGDPMDTVRPHACTANAAIPRPSCGVLRGSLIQKGASAFSTLAPLSSTTAASARPKLDRNSQLRLPARGMAIGLNLTDLPQ